MKYSNIKALKEFCNNLFSEPCYREVVEQVENGENDFTIENGNEVRFIKESEILSIMADEIFGCDDYVLGCFNASFIAENSDLGYELVKACQEKEAFEDIGKALNATLSQDEKESFCGAYASADGYGHHFNHWDGGCEEVTINGELYLVFDLH